MKEDTIVAMLKKSNQLALGARDARRRIAKSRTRARR
jgi:hypothetical protein